MAQSRITGATGTFSIPIPSYYHSFDFFGRTADVTDFLPYGVGTFQGEVPQQRSSVYRSGLMDVGARLSVNLVGGPAMSAPKFGTWKQKVILGTSLRVLAPTGQYDPTKIVNWGLNRWALKPELSYSERWGNCLVDSYAGM